VAALAVAGLPTALAEPLPGVGAPAQAVPATYVVVDVDTGNVVASADARTPHLPASTIKLLTALMAAERLPAGDSVPITALAESMPARKINVKAGQTWKLTDLMYCLLMISANDAAVAIAERTSGSLAEWTTLAQKTVKRLGLEDGPVLGDPSGLDDQFAQGGGSMISARDLAIIARAVLARPDLMAIIGTKDYSFTGGDGVEHHFTNHNLFLSLYEGATGMKTGTTTRAGSTFVGSATRGGRTMLVVELNAPDPYLQAGRLLDQAFAVAPSAEPTVDALPAVVREASSPTTVPPGGSEVALSPTASAPRAKGRVDFDEMPVTIAVFLLGIVGLVITRKLLFRTVPPPDSDIPA